jgi:redox-sensitive bicupin YhaK (pirin superfamily)
MDRKDFIRKGLMGTAFFAVAPAIANTTENDIDELQKLDVVGYNHLPNEDDHIGSNMVIHRANSRGTANHGWLQANFSFSFANYYNPDRMHFGVLRVLNDDIIAPGRGFGTHPHDNMEIITIPLEGSLEHKDSMGNVSVIQSGEIQVMSAGTGIKHSEFNAKKDTPVKAFQIWLFPKYKNVQPRYDQLKLDVTKRKNKFQQILSPNPNDEGVWIHQDAWFHMADMDNGRQLTYKTKKSGNGLYIMVVHGSAVIEGQNLGERDALGIWNTAQVNIKSVSPKTQILVLDVPMMG